jgi:signal transduction histidine kinase
LNLFQKQFLLVATLLVLELGLLGTLQILVQQAEREATRADNTNSIIVLADTITKDIWDMANCLIAAALARSTVTNQRYEELRHEVPAKVEALRQACIDSVDDQAYLQKISANSSRLLGFFDESHSLLLRRYEPGSMVLGAELWKRKFMPVLNELFAGLTQFVEAHKKLEVVQKQAAATAKARLNAMLGAGVVLQLVFAIAAGFYFSRSITSRIRVLADNAGRLARGESLHPPASGSDEIAQLDVVFHKMARELAEAAERERAIERMKEEFVSIVSHDLKAPLTSIQSSLGLVSKGTFGNLSGDGQKVVKAGQEETVRLIKLINDLLDLARIQAGRIELECQEIELSLVVTRALQSVEVLAEERGIELSSEPFTARVWADEDRLLQVMINLLTNAIKYSNRGQTVSISAVDADNLIEIRVIDHGCGISQEAQKHVFERFGQISQSDRKEKGGTGLGLAICKLIIEAHGGEIGVQSKLDQGSTFWFRIHKQPVKAALTAPGVGTTS